MHPTRAIQWAFELFDDTLLERLLTTDNDQDKPDHRLLCSACRHPITSTAQRIGVNGAHQHSVTNPHGIEFRIGCFRAASGCIQVGQATDEATWFSGYQWRIALCHHCRTHVGWGYRSAAGTAFFGLILDRLVSPEK